MRIGRVEADRCFGHLHDGAQCSFEQSGLVTAGNARVDTQNNGAGRQLVEGILSHDAPIYGFHCLWQGFSPGRVDALTDDHGRRVAMDCHRLALGGNDGGEVFSHATPHGRLDSEARVNASAAIPDSIRSVESRVPIADQVQANLNDLDHDKGALLNRVRSQRFRHIERLEIEQSERDMQFQKDG